MILDAAENEGFHLLIVDSIGASVAMLSLTLWIVLAAVVILIAFLLYIYTRLPKKIPVQFRGKHAFIT
ncbi:unnamed protein product, partial [Anisakis simplex]